MIKRLTLLLVVITIIFSCTDKMPDTPVLTDNFDRGEMLQFWAEDIIIPGYTAYVSELTILENEANTFFNDPTTESLESFRNAWLNSYLEWQEVSMFEIGKAEEVGLRNFTNIYPANVELINSNIEDANYNLDLPSNFSAQGFPALDYLLFGLGEDSDASIEAISIENVQNYTLILIVRLKEQASLVLEDWNQNFKQEFVSNKGSSATAATDKMVNDYLFYYERFLRAAKIGIPAGIFSGTESAQLVEAQYADIYSKQLFEKGFSAAKDFFEGISYDGSNEGLSLKQYLDEIHEENDTEVDYSASIISQWEAVDKALVACNDSFKDQIQEDNSKMLAVYDELQKAVVILKVDMLQALNIQVDFVDADGD